MPKIANALARLGTKRSWIVHGENGQDEIALKTKTFGIEVDTGVREFEITPEDFGFERTGADSLSVGGPSESAEMIRSILSGDRPTQAEEAIVLLNAAAALFISDGSAWPKDAGGRAVESLRSGAANKKLLELAEATPA
jgi:anthranilate phosphoribosyltransferase